MLDEQDDLHSLVFMLSVGTTSCVSDGWSTTKDIRTPTFTSHWLTSARSGVDSRRLFQYLFGDTCRYVCSTGVIVEPRDLPKLRAWLERAEAATK